MQAVPLLAGRQGLDAWDVDRLIELSRGLRPKVVALTEIADIFGVDRHVMDGMHRIARAILRGHTTITAVQFEVHPDPDYRLPLGRTAVLIAPSRPTAKL